MTTQTIVLEKSGSTFSAADVALAVLAQDCFPAVYAAALSSYNFTTSMTLNDNVVTLVRNWDSDSYQLYLTQQADNLNTITNNMATSGWTLHSNTVE